MRTAQILPPNIPERSEHSAGRRSAATLTRSLSRLQDGDSLSSYQQQIQHHRTIAPSCLWNGSLLASSHKFFSTEASAEISKDKGSTPSNKVSLALSVYFKQPELGMKDYEILSRATAFLLAVDPPPAPSATTSNKDGENTNISEESPYSSHLQENERRRQEKLYKQTHRYTPASGRQDGDHTNPDGMGEQQQRPLQDLSWLEFAPREVRPVVHVVCSSHVLSPFLWRQYYPQDWLNKVRQEHCTYSLEVYGHCSDGSDTGVSEIKSLAKFALNPYPIHHPEGKDVALIHLKDEDSSLKILQDLGVEILYMRDEDEIYEKGDKVSFDGYVVTSPTGVEEDNDDGSTTTTTTDYDSTNTDNTEEDTRTFQPYSESGELAFHTRDRFFALTPKPLPEGLCGGPVVDSNGHVCGVVEGIVPKDHANKDIAGAAAFMPNYALNPFIDFAERFMLSKILSKSLFQKAVTAKTTGQLGGGIFQKDSDGNFRPAGPGTGNMTYEEAFDRAVDQLKKNHSEEEVEAIINTIQRERREVLEILDKEGGDLDEIAERVRNRTLQIRDMIHEEYRDEVQKSESSSSSGRSDDPSRNVVEAEIVGGADRNTTIAAGSSMEQKQTSP
eukprot:CAMPEP_0113477650 /NCGR_PEP_ID=MMETSP0014_2-20120614/20317_1 /TAXON_ID=2857 /ORGANISM="Nitzschia sp." /LENGTH=613 /DNA_ID=CAMNT_0000370751 /DNA_START=80 /DNA_END=1922 /DNA_ORIENTATION=- /assembly_acc=CAM_ASM_000159